MASSDEDKEYLENIKQNLSMEQIETLVAELGGEPQIQNGIIKCKTICHCGNSHKLYYYDNTKLFRCYTECNDTWDIFQLIIKVKNNDKLDWKLPQAVNFISQYYGIAPKEKNNEQIDTLLDWKFLKKYDKINNNNNNNEKEEKKIELKIYDKKILKYLPHPRIIPWEREGITRDIMERNGICYDPVMQGIVIPHYDKDNQLIGIRERTLIKENEKNGKYKPAILNQNMYNHPLGFNLYNLNNSKENIKTIKKVIVFEGEKSCLLYSSYFGTENDISVACCGSSLVSYQFDLLSQLNVDEIIIAFDKQFQKTGDDEWKHWVKKLEDIHDRYGAKVQISYMFDKQDLLGYKDSPIDKGKDIFLEMFRERINL